jgi:hypothetical protein
VPKTFGDGPLVVRQKPDPGKPAEPGDQVTLVLAEPSLGKKRDDRVPNVKGMTVRRAMNRLIVDDFDVVIRGSGVVQQQVPPAGSSVATGSTVTLICEPRTITHAAVY